MGFLHATQAWLSGSHSWPIGQLPQSMCLPQLLRTTPHCAPRSAHVTFGFWRGVELDAGRGILESSGSVMAHMKIRSEDEIDDRVVARLVKDAVRLNREKGDPTKRR